MDCYRPQLALLAIGLAIRVSTVIQTITIVVQTVGAELGVATGIHAFTEHASGYNIFPHDGFFGTMTLITGRNTFDLVVSNQTHTRLHRTPVLLAAVADGTY